MFPDADTHPSRQDSINTLQKKDKEWLSNEISTLVDSAINAAAGSFKPHGGRKVAFFLREWGLAGTAIAVPIALLGIAAAAFYQANARVEKQATFEANTTNTLKEIDEHLNRIDTSLSTLQLEKVAADPTDTNNALAAKKAIDLARTNSVQLPAPLIENVGQKFVAASNQNPQAWNAALAFLDYKTSTNALPPVYSTSPIVKVDPAIAVYDYNSPTGTKPPTLFSSPVTVPKAQSAQYGVIGKDENASLTVGNASLIAQGGAEILDGMQFKHVVFRNVEIYYSGGPVVLSDVIFINCTFKMKPSRNSESLAVAILAPSATTTFSGE
jgi:hypothetical protein